MLNRVHSCRNNPHIYNGSSQLDSTFRTIIYIHYRHFSESQKLQAFLSQRFAQLGSHSLIYHIRMRLRVSQKSQGKGREAANKPRIGSECRGTEVIVLVLGPWKVDVYVLYFPIRYIHFCTELHRFSYIVATSLEINLGQLWREIGMINL